VRYLAVNDFGASDPTSTTSVALASLPAQAAAPTKVQALSSISRIVVEWTPPASVDSPGGDITGYRLEMDDGLGGDLVVIYDGQSAPSLRQFAVGNSSETPAIVLGRPYRFRLAARVFNGLGPASAITTIYSCSPPSGLLAPR